MTSYEKKTKLVLRNWMVGPPFVLYIPYHLSVSKGRLTHCNIAAERSKQQNFGGMQGGQQWGMGQQQFQAQGVDKLLLKVLTEYVLGVVQSSSL